MSAKSAPKRYWQCRRKARIGTEAKAEHEARAAEQRYDRPAHSMNHYACSWCDGWHIGNLPVKRRPPLDITLLDELGDRAYGYGQSENYAPARHFAMLAKAFARVCVRDRS